MKVSSLIDTARQQASKVTELTGKALQKLDKGTAKKIDQGTTPASTSSNTNSPGQVIEGQATERLPHENRYDDIQQLFRGQLPSISRKALGRRFGMVDKAARLVMPNGIEQASDTVLNTVQQIASQLGATERVLAATNSRDIQTLQQDPDRSGRAGNALKERNKVLAAVQGAVSGMTGFVGAAADLPLSVLLSLKTIYEIGHAYGFELDSKEDHAAILKALSAADLGLISEKQTLFLALRALNLVFSQGDFTQLQAYLNTQHSIDQFRQVLMDQNGNYRWNGLQHVSKLRVFRYATPVIGGVLGAYYNVRLVDAVAEQANTLFKDARQLINADPANAQLSFADAFARIQQKPAGLVALPAVDQDAEQSSSVTEQKEPAAAQEPQALSAVEADNPQNGADTTQQPESSEAAAQSATEQTEPAVEESPVQAAEQVPAANETESQLDDRDQHTLEKAPDAPVETSAIEDQSGQASQPVDPVTTELKVDLAHVTEQASRISQLAQLGASTYAQPQGEVEEAATTIETDAVKASHEATPDSEVITVSGEDLHNESIVNVAIKPRNTVETDAAKDDIEESVHQSLAELAKREVAEAAPEEANQAELTQSHDTTDAPAVQQSPVIEQPVNEPVQQSAPVAPTFNVNVTAPSKTPVQAPSVTSQVQEDVATDSPAKDADQDTSKAADSNGIVQVTVKVKSQADKDQDKNAEDDIEQQVHASFEELVKKAVDHKPENDHE